MVLASGGGSAKERELQAELTKVRKWAAQMQSERDHILNKKQQQQDRPRSRSRGDRHGGGKGHGDQRPNDNWKKGGGGRKGGKKGGGRKH